MYLGHKRCKYVQRCRTNDCAYFLLRKAEYRVERLVSNCSALLKKCQVVYTNMKNAFFFMESILSYYNYVSDIFFFCENHSYRITTTRKEILRILSELSVYTGKLQQVTMFL
jgi:hypothetical protein